MKKKNLILLPALAFALTGPLLNDAGALTSIRASMSTLTAEAQKLAADATASKEGFTAEVDTKISAILDQVDKLRVTEKSLERLEDNAKHLSSVPPDQRPALSLELDGVTGEDAKAVQGFSIMRMMYAKLTGNTDGLTGADKHILAMATAEATQKGFSLNGFGVPASAMKSLKFRNDMSATGGSSGSEGGKLIKTDYRELITPLVDQSILPGMGVTIFNDLRGNVEMPVITALGTPSTKTETSAADELTATTTVKTMSPRRLPAYVDVTTQLLRQESYGVQNFILQELSRQFSLVVDDMALNGSGSSNQPTGLFGTAGIGSVAIGTNGGAPTWAKVVELETKVDVANAAQGRLAYLTSKNGKGVLKTTQRVSGQSQMLWEGESVNGYTGYSTNLITSVGTKGSGTALTKLAFGNWQDIILGFWGGVDIVAVQDKAQAIGGLKSIVMEGFYDILVRRAASFAVCTDMNSV